MTTTFTSPLPPAIDELWERRQEITPSDTDARATIVQAVDDLDSGKARVAFVDTEAPGQPVVVDERAKRSILLSFRVLEMQESSMGDAYTHDRIPLKRRFDGVRVVPGAIARWGSYLAPGVVLMPSFTNFGAYVGSGTMIDTWATVGSCAQVGENVHVSGGAGIGGVLEPPQASPVVVEDDAFLGSRSMVVEGARVRRGAKLGAGTILTSSTRVFDAETGEELPQGEAPAWSVCVTANRVKSFPGGDFGMPCLLVLKRIEEGAEHDKLALNDMLREHGVNA
ncbi:2,3,4,5-tetrahydropyridine-2,6-dicarboxylate N-succinyltransferase [Lipingzhangella sp. LS1_29]|uniref:2,3,4,5-tetrahydropyridine-2,6-dicarboxylate N-succinyltransferase n=1 Tax=Lipingzhangella rawalii TaxID=2055835 RepID=A0ABU2HB82_9ACTN|nr:2,3,4,5-tetrahydropyridine-2,6-dicarboxylate N-succinyltransferase [Lipingzhangella rawalii]MDS1272075.1 2,3,4,5-tetrahydropyridine-2,6-dicarboxylate N-succinyltransferase [Lipingzhangella rawalii]